MNKPMTAPTMAVSKYAHGATLSLILIIALGIAQEMWLAPLRPGGSWLVLKVVPLLFAVRGVLRQDNYTMQWSSMLILLYFTEGIVRANSDQLLLSARLGWLQVALCGMFFYCTLSYLRPIKKAAKAAAKAASLAANDATNLTGAAPTTPLP